MLAAKGAAAAHSDNTPEGNPDEDDTLPEEHPDDPQPEEEGSLTTGSACTGDAQQSEEAAWNEYGNMLENGLGELRALRAQLRS